jgi:hypothetical protein
VSNDEGLTRPLINNIGGMIDQDAPSADQLTGGRDEDVLDDSGVVEGGRTPHVGSLYEGAGNVIPDPAEINSGPERGPRINPD